MLDIILSVMGGFNTAYDCYKKASGIIKPNENNQVVQQFEQMTTHFEKTIERLSDTILYAPNLETVRDITQSNQRKIENLRDVRESLEPVQKALGQEILSSAMILTPDKMEQALAKSPWEVLMDIRPVNLAGKPANADMVPVLFNHNGVQYLGWQMRGTLPILFDCDYKELWQSNSEVLEISSTLPPKDKVLQFQKEQVKREEKLPETERKRETKKYQIFEFDVVTVTGFKKGWFGKTIITKKGSTRKQASYDTEYLPNGVILDMVSIQGGTFMMGSPETENDRYDDESPQHKVIISPFDMGKYPVTQAQWLAVMGKNPSYFKGDNRPVENVSWNEVVEFCHKISDITSKTYSLPTEAEWEYACRAGTITPFYFGETIGQELVNYDGNHDGTTDVGSFPPNAFGLYDMHGNVWEWTCSEYHDKYQGDEILSKNTASQFVRRGGSWSNEQAMTRSANRDRDKPTGRYGSCGFRLVRTA